MGAALLENRGTGPLLISLLENQGCGIKEGRAAPVPGTKEGLHEYVYPRWGPSEMEMQ